MYVTVNESIQKCYHPISMNHIGGVIVSMLASRAVNRGFESVWSNQSPNTIKYVFASSPLNMQH